MHDALQRPNRIRKPSYDPERIQVGDGNGVEELFRGGSEISLYLAGEPSFVCDHSLQA